LKPTPDVANFGFGTLAHCYTIADASRHGHLPTGQGA
jgi:hypothetical protein